jgi:hypothetical protein
MSCGSEQKEISQTKYNALPASDSFVSMLLRLGFDVERFVCFSLFFDFLTVPDET